MNTDNEVKVDRFEALRKEFYKELQKLKRTSRYPTNDCYTLKEVAEMSGKSLQTIRNEKNLGKLIVRFPNAEKCCHVDDVEDWLRGCKRNARGLLR